MKKIILLIGKSGSGKTTIADILQKRYGLKTVNSYTTRKPRFNGELGHIFVDDEAFNKIISEKNIVGYTEYCGYRYCADEEMINNSDVYVTDPYSAKFLKTNYKGSKSPFVVYISVDENVRKTRMIERGDNEKDIYYRLLYDTTGIAGFSDAEDVADMIININKDVNSVTAAKKIWYEYINR